MKSLKEQFREIKTQLSVGVKVSANLINLNVSEIFKIISVSVINVQEVLIFILEIPLVINYDFVFYKTLPLPVQLKIMYMG